MILEDQLPQNINGTIATQIRYQIDQLKQEHVKPGWNLWIILTAIAGCIWLLIQEIEKKFGQANQIIYIILLLLIIEQIIGNFPISFSINKLKINNNRYYTSNFLLVESKKLSFYHIPKYSIIIFLILHLSLFQGSFKILMISYYAWGIISSLLIFVFSKYTFPVPASSMGTNKAHKVLQIIISLFLILIAYKTFLYTNMKSELLLINIKYAGLIFTTLYLIPLLIKQTFKNPFISALEEVYKDLIFNVIKPEDAKSRADLIVNGLNYKYYFQNEFIDIIDSIHNLDNVCTKVSKLIDSANSITNEDLCNNEEKKMFLEALIDSIHYNHGLLDTLSKDLEKKLDKFIFKIKMVDALDKSSSELLEIKNEIKTAITKAKEHSREISQKKVNYVQLS
ncbi:MAG: hypothetical protein N3I35_04795 [Clostridia bacterium]|nr:hypothetical protein [Clostridia bacterium]